MANSRSARKRIRANERKHVRNRTVRSAVRTKITRVRRSLVAGQTADIDEELHAAIKALDKAAEKGILHRRNVARRKSRIASMAARVLHVSGSEAEQAEVRAAAAGGAKGRKTRATAARSATAATPKAKPAAAAAAKAKPAATATTRKPKPKA